LTIPTIFPLPTWRIAKWKHIIIKRLSLKNTIEYIGEWEILFNPDFNYTEFGTVQQMKPLAAAQSGNMHPARWKSNACSS
jgi:hypothetical protein